MARAKQDDARVHGRMKSSQDHGPSTAAEKISRNSKATKYFSRQAQRPSQIDSSRLEALILSYSIGWMQLASYSHVILSTFSPLDHQPLGNERQDSPVICINRTRGYTKLNSEWQYYLDYKGAKPSRFGEGLGSISHYSLEDRFSRSSAQGVRD